MKYLCEEGGASEAFDGVRGVDIRSKGGWTPLSESSGQHHIVLQLMISCPTPVNAASKGHLPVVLYLLTKQNADPFVRNKWGETAYDAAAAVFEVWICEVSGTRILQGPRLTDTACRSCRRPRSRIGATGMYPTIRCPSILQYHSCSMRTSASISG